ncbi:MAG: hypothetical protein AAFU85_04450 [Planctomycetota bacterium]
MAERRRVNRYNRFGSAGLISRRRPSWLSLVWLEYGDAGETLLPRCGDIASAPPQSQPYERLDFYRAELLVPREGIRLE